MKHGGPIIAVQIENEYGSYGHDKDYMEDIHQALIHAGFGDWSLEEQYDYDTQRNDDRLFRRDCEFCLAHGTRYGIVSMNEETLQPIPTRP